MLEAKDLKCKNHLYITDYAKGKKLFLYLVMFPRLLFHQVVCVDNPILHKTSNTLYEKYDKYIPEKVKQMYKISEENFIQFTKKITKVEKLK